MSGRVDLTRLRELAEHATPGPWKRNGGAVWGGNLHKDGGDWLIYCRVQPGPTPANEIHNAEFIATSRNLFVLMVDVIEAAQEVDREMDGRPDVEWVGPNVQRLADALAMFEAAAAKETHA